METFWHIFLIILMLSCLVMAFGNYIASQKDEGAAMPIHGFLTILSLLMAAIIAIVLLV